MATTVEYRSAPEASTYLRPRFYLELTLDPTASPWLRPNKILKL